MIPKVIHYCWFGKNPLPELAQKCIDSWKKFCPDYKLIEWNETTFDISSNQYVKEAYQARQWAFVTDYVRLYALVTYGGIYMDTDVEVIQPLDSFLSEKAFSGFEDEASIPTGIMACEKDFPLFKILLSEYNSRHFIRPDGSFDKTTNVQTITKTCLQHGLVLNNSLQTIEGFSLYPKEIFCPKDYQTGRINLTDNSHTIHHFSGSWHSEKEKNWRCVETFFAKYKIGKIVINSKPARLLRLLYVSGWKGVKNKIMNTL